MLRSNRVVFGIISALIYVILSALSGILRNLFLTATNDGFGVLIASITAILFFNVINYRKILPIYRQMLTSGFKDFLMINLLVIGMWLGSFIIPKYYSPAFQIFTFMTTVSMLGYLFNFLNKKQLPSLLGFIAALSLLIFYYGQFIYNNTGFLFIAVGVGLSFITGVFGYYYSRFTHKIFLKYDFSASQILSIRFWLLTFLAGVSIPLIHVPINIGPHIIIQLMLLGFLSLIIPIYFYQIAIVNIGPDMTSIIIGITPAICFYMEQSILPNLVLKLNSINYLLIIAIFVIVNLLNWTVYQRKQHL